MPVGADRFSEALRWASETFHTLKKMLKDAGHNTNVGDEGGFAPNLGSAKEALDFVVQGDREGRLQARRRHLHRARPRLDRVLQGRRLRSRRRGAEARRRPTWRPITPNSSARLSDHLDRGRHGRGRLGRLEGADRPDRRQGASSSATISSSPIPSACATASSAASPTRSSIKVNQIGSLTETLDAVSVAHRAGYTAVMSHRSGETEDSTIADLAVATNCGQIKTGSLARSDRLAKYNQLLRIEEELGDQAVYRRSVDPQGLSRAAPVYEDRPLRSEASASRDRPGMPSKPAPLQDGYSLDCPLDLSSPWDRVRSRPARN